MSNSTTTHERGVIRLLADEQRELLKSILNILIPQDGALPAAGDLGCTDTVEAAAAAKPSLRRLFLDGLSSVVILSDTATVRGFLDLDADNQSRVLSLVEAARPVFFSTLVDLTYQAYYVDPLVHRALGYDGSPPHPRGYQLPKFDPAILDMQRRRLPLWRATDTLKPNVT